MSLKMYYVNIIIMVANSLATVLSFLESCIKNGSINMNVNELYNENTNLFISIPER
jgi:hypothetical protein